MSTKGTTIVTNSNTTSGTPAPISTTSRPGHDILPSFDYYLTRPYDNKSKLRNKILTSHVGSLPPTFGKNNYSQIFQQIDIGLDVINDGEINRSSYVAEVLGRLGGFEMPEDADSNEDCAASVPHDVRECPGCARRFMGKSSLITLNERYPARNPCCVGEISYNTKEIKQYLDDYTLALRQNGTNPDSAFYSCPSPGTLAGFFKNSKKSPYKTQEDYLEALANALNVEYKEIVSRGFTLQVDCPDLAMSRHTNCQKMSDREYVVWHRKLIHFLNLSIRDIPKSHIRVHICWGNYGFSHHRDIGLEKIVDNLNLINCSELLIENANPRHNHEIETMSKIQSPMNICLGVIDTSSPHVENPHLIAKRLCKLAQLIGPERVRAGTDCGFATTSESNANTEIVFMKLRSMVQGARIASSILFNGVSLFQPRNTARLYWFGDRPQRTLPGLEIRYVPIQESYIDVGAVASHMKSYTDLPVFFVYSVAAAWGNKSENLNENSSNMNSKHPLGRSSNQNLLNDNEFRKETNTSVILQSIEDLKTLLEGTAAYPSLDTIISSNHDEIFSEVRDFLHFDRSRLKLKDRFLKLGSKTSDSQPDSSYDVVIVGAGITGLYVASQMKKHGIKFCLLEKDSGIGGIWKRYANERSQVNTSEAAYRLREVLEEQCGTGNNTMSVKKRANKDHSTTREILTDAVDVAKYLGNSLFLKSEVKYIDKTRLEDGSFDSYRVRVAESDSGTNTNTNPNKSDFIIRTKGVILAINDRVGERPRQILYKNQERFQGEIRDGFSNDASDLDWVGKRVVIVGMGAFATENLRTALEGGAASVTILARRHGTVCPKYIDYVNFINKNPALVDSLSHDSVTNTRNMITWRDLYERVGAKLPECWMGSIKHYGHTISVSDIYFIAHHLRILDSMADEIDYFVEEGLYTKGLSNGGNKTFIQCDIVIRCTGFERNAQLIPKLTPYKEVNSSNYLDKNFMYLADALIDDNVFNSVFGSSVLEMAKMFCSIYLYFWENPEHYSEISEDGENLLKLVPVEERKWSDYIQGLDVLCSKFNGINLLAKKQIEERYKAFIQAHTVQEYLRENQREWNELHHILGVWSEETAYLPYPKWSSVRGGGGKK